MAKRKAPDKDTLRELYLKSGNQCAFPNCTRVILNSDGVFVGQICHIEAAEEGGERFNPVMSDDERAAFSNLMLMCYEHHVITNDVITYTVEALQLMKAKHEIKFTDPAQAILDGDGGELAHGVVQIGNANRAVTGSNSGMINMGDSYHHYHQPMVPQVIELEPTASEVEILTLLADSQSGYLNAINFDGGFEVLIDGRELGGTASSKRSVQLHDAVERLVAYGFLSDLQRNGEIYHISTGGRDAVRQYREQIEQANCERELLVAAAIDGLFHIIERQMGSYVLASKGKMFSDQHDPAVAARYLEAFHRLRDRGLVVFEVGQMYRLTGTGFDLARKYAEDRASAKAERPAQ